MGPATTRRVWPQSELVCMLRRGTRKRGAVRPLRYNSRGDAATSSSQEWCGLGTAGSLLERTTGIAMDSCGRVSCTVPNLFLTPFPSSFNKASSRWAILDGFTRVVFNSKSSSTPCKSSTVDQASPDHDGPGELVQQTAVTPPRSRVPFSTLPDRHFSDSWARGGLQIMGMVAAVLRSGSWRRIFT